VHQRSAWLARSPTRVLDRRSESDHHLTKSVRPTVRPVWLRSVATLVVVPLFLPDGQEMEIRLRRNGGQTAATHVCQTVSTCHPNQSYNLQPRNPARYKICYSGYELFDIISRPQRPESEPQTVSQQPTPPPWPRPKTRFHFHHYTVQGVSLFFFGGR